MGDIPPDNDHDRDDKRPPAPTRRPGGYYYDDQTGYEPYDPAADEDDDEVEADEKTERP